MVKKIVWLGIVFGIITSVSVYAASDFGIKNSRGLTASTQTTTVMDQYTGFSNTTSFEIGFRATSHTWAIDLVGVPSNLNVKLEGSVDRSAWFTLDTYSTTSPEDSMRWVNNKGADYVRWSIITFTGNSTITIKSNHGE